MLLLYVHCTATAAHGLAYPHKLCLHAMTLLAVPLVQ